MPRIHPLYLFPPHIAERGLLYFEQGKVHDVQKTSAGRYRAEVCGSENYWVWLKLDSDLYIKQAVAYIKPRACLRAYTLPMNHKEFEIYV
ncbi:TPA: SWIM zinc finger family protein [Neisseria subflava]